MPVHWNLAHWHPNPIYRSPAILPNWMKRLRILIVVCVCALLLMGCQETPTGTPSQVMRVASGQTIEVPDPTGQTAFNQKVRLIGISAPSWEQQPWSQDAYAYLKDLLQNQPVLLETDQQRTLQFASPCPGGELTEVPDIHLAYVWKDGVLINEKLVEEGLALVDVRSPNLKYEQRLNHAQQTARILGRGIWNPENPMRLTPEEFRQQEREESAEAEGQC